MMKKKAKDFPVLPVIFFTASFDTSSPNSKVVILHRDGGKLILEFPASEVKNLFELYERAKDKTFTVIFDIDNVLSIPELILAKQEYLEQMRFDVQKFREKLAEISKEDVSDLTDDQIKALHLMSNLFEEVDDREIAFFLNVSISQVRLWKRDEKFQRLLNILIQRQLQNSAGLILKKIVQGAMKSSGASDRKILANILGLTDENKPFVFPIIIEQIDKLEEAVERRWRELNLEN